MRDRKVSSLDTKIFLPAVDGTGSNGANARSKSVKIDISPQSISYVHKQVREKCAKSINVVRGDTQRAMVSCPVLAIKHGRRPDDTEGSLEESGRSPCSRDSSQQGGELRRHSRGLATPMHMTVETAPMRAVNSLI